MKIGKAFGKALRQLRTTSGHTQESLALECELDRTFISLLERGERQPSLSTVFALAAVLGCRPSVLISFVEDHYKP